YESESGSNYHWTTAYQYPVSRQFSISASWMSAWALSGTARDAYDRYPNAAGQLTDSLNALYSSRYRLRNITNAAAATLMFSGKKYKARLGGEFRHLAQQGIGLSAVQERSFKNLVPAAHVALSLSRQSVLNIAYTAQLMQPDMNKIRPLLNNADPMNIVIGNPQLTQSLAHNTHAGYSYTTANGARSLQASGSLSVIRKAISLEQYTDAEGRRTSRYYNQDGNYTTNVSLDYEQSLGNHIRCSAGPSAGFSRTITRINKETSTALSPLFGFRTALQYNKDTLLNIRLDAAASTVATRSALHAGQRARAQSFSGTMNIQYRFPQGRLSLGSACSWNYLRGSLGSGNSFVVWNVSVQREMNKEQSLVLKLYVYDLLNRSKGYLAYNEQNIQREERFISLQRFFLLGLIWHFTKR
ncbi:MAG: outer membrane beta-barrel protein, partial [Chitinophagaceae bacterium]|nr:outer membrane beta-barrel protein [Chitinophagaceae bacterium]